ncbi:uncharacterized protein LOC116135229 [Pistacia vera]|uniref:uncharacterized protein LOC116135229 n=1 Tax=Pistacia vera TaxID=55513 RepID=UPI001262EA04|nr:uncharacterized protein LOC116135229 [Pistacia vera]
MASAMNNRSSSPESNSSPVTTIDFNHQLYLHPSDTPAKKKLGFIDGRCTRDSVSKNLQPQWDRCNAIVLSWIMNSVTKDLLSGIVYASDSHLVWQDLKERFDKLLWDEYSSMIQLPTCECAMSKIYVDHMQSQKLLQFLMGLNETYIQARGHILMMQPLPSVDQAYSMLITEESQRGITASSYNDSPLESTVLYFTSQSQTKQKKNWNVVCEHCHVKGHQKSPCIL